MEFYEFAGLMASAALLFYVLMAVIEKAVELIAGKDINPILKISISFIGALGILAIWQLNWGSGYGLLVAVMGGVIILFNRYWFFHAPTDEAVQAR